MDTQKDWFSSWFNTPYYHILYKNRDVSEARVFIKHITSFLKIPKTAHLLDLACGKGRHSVYLNSLGYTVTGLDLSENNIKEASKKTNDHLKFQVHDMREPFLEKYDAIFNVFTSFGYFEDDATDINVLKNIKEGLREGGVVVIDFLNVHLTKKTLIEKEIKTIDSIDFHIHKKIENGFILKEISFQDNQQEYSYLERVKYIDYRKFTDYFKEAGLSICHTFGDYQLAPFDENTSKRLIFILK